MKKQLTNPTLANELREGSSFFRRPALAEAPSELPAADVQEAASQPGESPVHASRPDIETKAHHDITLSGQLD